MKKFLSLFLSLLLFPSLAFADLEFHFLDVGHGECTIVTNDGKAVIIDGGPMSASDTIKNYLSKLGIEKLECIIVTSPEDEHIGGIPLNDDSRIAIYSPVRQYDSRIFDFMLSDHSSNIMTPENGEVFALGDAKITFYTGGTSSDASYAPYMVKVSDGSITVLICGDADAATEKALLDANSDLKADVMRISHHSTKKANTSEFISAISPAYVVISCTEQDDAPPADVLLRYLRQSIPVLCTDYNGTIIINAETLSKKETVPVTCERWYIGNVNSEVFHRHTCTSVVKMREYNKVPIYNSYEAVYHGFDPCKNCSP